MEMIIALWLMETDETIGDVILMQFPAFEYSFKHIQFNKTLLIPFIMFEAFSHLLIV